MSGNWVVIFKSKRSSDTEGYDEMVLKMESTVKDQPGFISMNSFQNTEGFVTICYWKNLESIKAWKSNTFHQEAITKGQDEWYTSYKVEVAKIEYEYSNNVE
jgi:heme-degrading monooxygenase HmoA